MDLPEEPGAGGDLTGLIESFKDGPGVPVDALWQAAYAELKKVARARLRGNRRNTVLDTTALVNESYLKLARLGRLRVESRGKFFAYASRVMRSVIVDLVRERQAERRGGGVAAVTLDTAAIDSSRVALAAEPLRVDAALAELEKVEPRLARVVEMRYFAGLSEIEIATALDVTDRTVRRDWQKAKLLLHSMLQA
ncbi:MAG: sigma-70 family RNA polymerase sigma factor [Thermoanaerobaculia bacterium]|nr:sigma-70 family RNA polymerase sigma factor [Thermoanaerobaculia bacterium]MBP9824589.1 sigma-70 family RNA polymerase sigma factor [Thermoanaerobaculia bacterium]